MVNFYVCNEPHVSIIIRKEVSKYRVIFKNLIVSFDFFLLENLFLERYSVHILSHFLTLLKTVKFVNNKFSCKYSS